VKSGRLSELPTKFSFLRAQIQALEKAKLLAYSLFSNSFLLTVLNFLGIANITQQKRLFDAQPNATFLTSVLHINLAAGETTGIFQLMSHPEFF